VVNPVPGPRAASRVTGSGRPAARGRFHVAFARNAGVSPSGASVSAGCCAMFAPVSGTERHAIPGCAPVSEYQVQAYRAKRAEGGGGRRLAGLPRRRHDRLCGIGHQDHGTDRQSPHGRPAGRPCGGTNPRWSGDSGPSAAAPGASCDTYPQVSQQMAAAVPGRNSDNMSTNSLTLTSCSPLGLELRWHRPKRTWTSRSKLLSHRSSSNSTHAPGGHDERSYPQ
jgi:hypothetical protein